MASLFEQVQNQMRTAYSSLQDKYDSALFEQLLEPKHIFEVTITITKDNGSEATYQWRRAQHCNVKGPYKGWIRFHPDVSIDEVKSLSVWMSFKTAVVNLPLGWGKGWIVVDPRGLSERELEALCRGYIRAIADHIGPTRDVPAPDVNTNGKIMARMADEYSKITGSRSPWVITGKPLAIWGSKWREKATSRGGLMTLKRLFEHNDDSLSGKTIAIQWAGNVWLWFAELAAEAGGKVIAIADSKGGVFAKDWLDINKIIALKENHQSVTDYNNWIDTITNNELLALDCDILVPAAMENVLDKETAKSVKASIILELANGPTTTEGDTVLKKNNIVVIPDILANAWWVTVSYFEQVQNGMNYYREEEEVNEKLSKIMLDATDSVVATAKKHNITLREATYVIALERLLEAMQLRGW